MAQTIAQVVSALAASDQCSIVSMRSPKQSYHEILSDYANTENAFEALGGPSGVGSRRLVIVVDRMEDTGVIGTGFAKVERRI